MKHWIIGLLLLGIAIPLINSQHLDDDDDDYEYKRFHVQSRQLNGRSQCFMSRRKRSTAQAQALNGDDEDSMESQMGISTGAGNQQEDSTGLLIRDSDLAGNAGILVIQNGVSPNAPILFELRPVATDMKDTYFKDDPDSPDNSDSEDDDDDDDDNNGNRIKPNGDSESDESELESDGFDADEADDEEQESPPKRRLRPTTKKPKRRKRPTNEPESSDDDEDTVRPIKKKPKRPSSQPPRNKPKPNRKKNKNRNSTKNKNKKKKKKKNSKKRKGSSYNVSLNKKNRLGERINRGQGTNTVTNTVTTTQTGAGDPGVNCIIINKQGPSAPVQRPFWDILGRSTGDKEEDRGFGLRKRIRHRLFADR